MLNNWVGESGGGGGGVWVGGWVGESGVGEWVGLPIFLPFLPSYRQPTDLPQSTDFFADLPNFNFFYGSFCYFM